LIDFNDIGFRLLSRGSVWN